MEATFLQRLISTVESHLESKPSSVDFEMAYQTRVAIDRIRFAIKNRQFGLHSDQLREANLQLLDALDRLESADRHFQNRFRTKGPNRVDSTFEPHYTIADLARKWRLGRETVRLLVKDEPGVLKIRMGRRKAMTRYSVPESVARRVQMKLFHSAA